jgi:hypothetical protein
VQRSSDRTEDEWQVSAAGAVQPSGLTGRTQSILLKKSVAKPRLADLSEMPWSSSRL